MKPIIGIITRPGKSEDGHDTLYVYKKISDIVIKCGGIPLGIVPTYVDAFYGNNIDNTKSMTNEEFNDYKKAIDLCNGIISQGGDDYYDYDVKVIRYAYEQNKPLLGICLGMQAMACAFDGKMIDIGNNYHQQKKARYAHMVKLKPTSLLANILKEEYIWVNSRHKSKVIKTKLDVVGYSDDGVIEVVEDANQKFFIGVQWHPESMFEYDILTNRLFAHFIQICK